MGFCYRFGEYRRNHYKHLRREQSDGHFNYTTHMKRLGKRDLMSENYVYIQLVCLCDDMLHHLSLESRDALKMFFDTTAR